MNKLMNEVQHSLISCFENALYRNKDRVAVSFGNDLNEYKTLTFEEVYQLSISVTEVLLQSIKEECICIGLYMNHNPYIPSVIISLQKCKMCFIFLDPHAQPECNLKYIKLLNLKWIISDHQDISVNFLQKYATFLNTTLENVAPLKLWNISHADDEINMLFKDICYVVCTSGSTGEPKIVKVKFQCIFSNINCLSRIFKLSNEDVIYFGTPLTFDPSIIELFLALFNGCTLLIPPHRVKINPVLLLDKLFPKDQSKNRSVTVLQIVPSLFLRWRSSDIEFILQKSSCRVLAFGGEQFPQHILKLNRSKDLKIFNLYGITEISCWASCYKLKDAEEEISLGDPLDETILQVRNDNGSVITCGEGELFIGSSTRICYINDENELSLQEPVYRATGDVVRIKNNVIFYVSRKQDVVKRFGIKMNLPMIEKIVFQETELLSSCLWLEDKNKLILFVVITEFNLITKQKILDKLRVKLLHALPKHCFPDHIEIIPNIPTTQHGKTDKESLEQMYKLTVLSEMKKNPIELFKSVWTKYLGLNIHEIEKYNTNFFEAGGNSISAVQCLSEFQELIGIEYPNELIVLLFEKSLKDCCDFLCNAKTFPLKRPHELESAPSSKIQVTQRHNCGITLQILWKYNLEACVDSSPVIVKRKDVDLVAIGSFSHIFAVLNCNNGTLISKLVLPDVIESSCCNSTTDNNIYIGCYDCKMYCIDVTSANIIWEYTTGDRIKSTPCKCLQNEALCFGSYDKSIHCISALSGDLIWKTEAKGSIAGDVLHYKDCLYVATISGSCICLHERNGEILWQHNIGVPIFGSPCIVHCDADIIVWPDVNGTLHSFSISCPEKKGWTFATNGNIYCSLTTYKNYLFFGCHDHNFYCLQINKDSCDLIYKVLLDSAINSNACIAMHRNEVYIVTASNNGNVYFIHLNSGNIVANLYLPDKIYSSPAVLEDKIYIGCRDNNLYCLKITNDQINK